MVSLSGSGDTGKKTNQLRHILANRAWAEQRSRGPNGAGVGRVFIRLL